jgi:hypothetical protein
MNENNLMPEERINPLPQEGENVDSNKDSENTSDERFVSDTQKLVRKHLEDKEHVITEDDIANVRVGMVPPEFDSATEARFEGTEAREEAEKDLLSGTEDMKKDENLDESQITPWDTIDPTK